MGLFCYLRAEPAPSHLPHTCHRGEQSSMKQEYVQTPEELIAELNTSPDGLSSAEAAARLEKYGPTS